MKRVMFWLVLIVVISSLLTLNGCSWSNNNGNNRPFTFSAHFEIELLSDGQVQARAYFYDSLPYPPPDDPFAIKYYYLTDQETISCNGQIMTGNQRYSVTIPPVEDDQYVFSFKDERGTYDTTVFMPPAPEITSISPESLQMVAGSIQNDLSIQWTANAPVPDESKITLEISAPELYFVHISWDNGEYLIKNSDITVYSTMAPGTNPLNLKITRCSNYAIKPDYYYTCVTNAIRHGADGLLNLVVQ